MICTWPYIFTYCTVKLQVRHHSLGSQTSRTLTSHCEAHSRTPRHCQRANATEAQTDDKDNHSTRLLQVHSPLNAGVNNPNLKDQLSLTPSQPPMEFLRRIFTSKTLYIVLILIALYIVYFLYLPNPTVEWPVALVIAAYIPIYFLVAFAITFIYYLFCWRHDLEEKAAELGLASSARSRVRDEPLGLHGNLRSPDRAYKLPGKTAWGRFPSLLKERPGSSGSGSSI
ncbi:hypothetical protein M011DRAFT_102378 [Sporormia fimetaria CBS 119925]|uniref:Uncharacterized protein n=1 Tax=Sporormia fimetaria CBS 119925 TaxID=1340428 RepID=A0A6A6VPE9_9PLEO|nr:hypothetical protein M011DRAFT_102378 [Sporormia fimetaria CBS 119925]